MKKTLTGELPRILPVDVSRYWSYVDCRGENECWPWTGGDKSRYGRFWLCDKLVQATRAGFAIVYGADPMW